MAGAAALACGWGMSQLQAELTWAQKAVELQADSKASVIEARFRFINKGSVPIDILQVQTSCGCTTAALAQRHCAPGQSGEVIARFTVGERVGLQKKTILVSTSDGPVPTALTLVVHIPELLRIQPAFVLWKQGEPRAAKTLQIEAAQENLPLKDVSVLSSNPAVAVQWQPVVEGKKYQIVVTPDTTEKPLFSTLTIHCGIGSEQKTFHAYVSVSAPTLPANISTAPAALKSPPQTK
jgi:hypothetical protein